MTYPNAPVLSRWCQGHWRDGTWRCDAHGANKPHRQGDAPEPEPEEQDA